MLRIHEQGNTSLVVVFLGRELGQFRVHAKGARKIPKKGFEAGFDLLARGEILLYPRRGDTLWLYKEWDERARPAVGSSLPLLRAASYLCELTEALTRHTAGAVASAEAQRALARSNRRLYDLLAAAADALASGAQPGALLLAFTLHALQCEGLLPDLAHCGECGLALEKALSSKLGSRDSQSRQSNAVDLSGLRVPTTVSAIAPAVWLSHEGLLCAGCFSARRNRPPALPRGVRLAPEVCSALLFTRKTARPVRLGAAAARQLAQALIVLVHGALERDLRTLNSAARAVAASAAGQA